MINVGIYRKDNEMNQPSKLWVAGSIPAGRTIPEQKNT